MSDGLSDYMRDKMDSADLAAAMSDPRRWRLPIVPRRDDIRVINPPPPYFWLGREAEALNG